MFTYIPANIKAFDTDVLSSTRWLIADTDSTDYEYQDEEIQAAFDNTTGDDNKQKVYNTALELARNLYRKYSRRVNYSSAGTSVSNSDLANKWSDVISELESDIAILYPNTTQQSIIYGYRLY